MKLTKKIEAEITQFLQSYWDTYFEGNLSKWQSFLNEDYKNIGTNQEEIWNSKKEILDYTNEVLDQMVGQAELRNKKVQIILYEPYIMTHELGDLFVKAGDEWTFYAPIRLSSLIQRKDGEWVVLHQHGSFPDSKTQKGEAFGLDALKAENAKLQKAVKKRTFELEKKNRKLEIETALERIRAQAVAMKESSDLLDIVVTMRNEFIKLGHEAHYFWHMMWLPDTYEKAMTSGDGSKIGFVMKLPRHMHGDIPQLAKWEKSKKPTVVYAMDAEEAIAYVDKMVALGDFKNIDPQAPTHDDIKQIGGLTFIMARTTHGEIGYSLPGVVKKPPKEDIDILVKFAGAFDLAHQRFLDLQKAERQSRETQIELALEKVRSRSLAMHNTSELQDVIHVVHDELLKLDISIFGGSFITINNEIDSELRCWGSGGTANTSEEIIIPYVNKPFYTNLLKGIKKGPGFFTESYSNKEKKEFFKHLLKHKPWSELSAKEKKDILSTEGGYTRSCNVLQHTSIFIINHYGRPFTQDENEILKRFGKVFEQTYTRFLDLQKAEAQAREAQIEAALERIRSRSMAMQKSDELLEAGELLYNELKKLGIDNLTTGYVLFNADAKIGYSYGVNPVDGSIRDFPVEMPHNETSIMKSIVKSWKNEESSLIIELNEEETIKHQTFIAERSKNFPISAEKLLAISPERLKIHTFNFKQGYLLLIGSKLLTETEQKLVIRFAKVFEQTYTRFLDLQKAEAQTREAQIEMALEKVRSRTMAMQHSEELPEAANLLFTEVQKLGIPAWSCGYNILADDKKSSICIMSSEGELQTPFVLPLTKHKSLKPWYKAIKNNEDFFVYNQDGKDLVEHYDYMKSLPDLKATFKQLEDAGLELPTQQYNHLVKFNEGFLLFITYEEVPEAHGIFKRFGKVFNQTYTRFLDLQKAEAQAREAQIEAALERVRSRSTGMQHSDELVEVAILLREEMGNLGVEELETSSIYIVDEESNKTECWFSIQDNKDEKNLISDHMTIDLKDTWVGKKMLGFYQSNNRKTSIVMQGENRVEWINYCAEKSELFNVASFYGDSIPERIYHLYKFKYGFMGAAAPEEISEESWDLLKRATSVFSMAYTRFSDLKKAEAQAREAKVEAAMERIRSRSMAMQKSEELNDVILEIHKKFKELDISMESRVAIVVVSDPDNKDFNQYIAAHDLSNIYISTPYFKHPVLDDYFEAKEAGVEFFSKSYSEKEKNSYFKTFFETSNLDDIEGIEDQKKWVFAQKFYTHSQAFQKNSCIGIADYSGIPLTEFEIDIIIRFSKVFDQAYTRFLDLQKAEAQTREAQINLAVERVRAKALAMHKSEEILGVVAKLKDEVLALDIPDVIAATIFLKEGTDNVRMWDLSSLEENNNGYEIPFDITFKLKKRDPNLYIKRIWENPDDYFIEIQNKKDFKRIIGWLREQNESKFAFEVETFIDETELKCLHHAVKKLNNGRLVIDLLNPPSEEMETILTKMGAAFDLAYKRFEDLQKAEAQTREAQIEVAVERVRAEAMAMHSSDDFGKVNKELWEQVQKLNVTGFAGAGIFLFDKNDHITYWDFSSPGNIGQHKHKLYQYDYKKYSLVGKEIRNSYQSGEPYCLLEYDLNRLKKAAKEWESIDASIATGFKEAIASGQLTYQWGACGRITNGFLIFDHLEQPDEDSKNILIKMSNAFDLAYQRFLDLQKAEAQTREAQIQLALERVRARTMAMQHSDELVETSELLFQQIKDLGIELWSCGYSLWYDDDSYFIGYNPMPDGKMGPTFKIPLTEDIFFKTIREAKRKGDKFLVFESKGKSLVRTYQYMDTLPVVGEAMRGIVDAGFDLPKYQVTHCGFFTHGHLMFITHQHYPEAHDIFKRFTKEFEQAYTRFLDLQKSEAQAREANIEAALERVRSRSIAMHNSEELLDVITIVSEQLSQLNLRFAHVSFAYNNIDQDYKFWTYAKAIPKPMKLSVPYLNIPLLKNLREAQRKELSFFTDYLTQEEHQEWHLHLLNHCAADLFTKEINEYTMSKQVVRSIAINPNIMLILANYTSIPYTEEENDIIRRFGHVFEQTYTRFLDLQKAEAQAREAQIENALEKVRSRSLAMHQSTEMQQVANEVHAQFHNLGLDIDALAMSGVIENEKDYDVWIGGENYKKPLRIPYNTDTKVQRDYNKAIKERSELFTKTYKDKTKDAYFKHLMASNKFDPKLEKMMLQCSAFTTTLTFMKNSGIQIVRYNNTAFTDEDNNIVKRFGRVFEQAYIRFLDLQKSEVQTKEAKIEAALERVRSQSMGMQTSKDLSKVTTEMFNQLRQLGGDLFATGIVFCDKHEGHVEQWHSLPDAGMMSPFIVPIDLDYIHQYRYDEWKKGTDLFSVEIPSDFIEQHFQDIFNLPSAQKVLKDFEDQNTPMPEAPPWEIDYGASFKNGYILVSSLQPFEDAEILPRFAKVFEQTYTRYLDLKKAEKQAREAQIEAALERVRAKAMSMQNSDELDEVLSVLCEQFDILGIVPMSTHMTVFDFENNTFTFRETGKFGNRSFGEQTVALDAMDNWKETVDKWKADEATAINKLHFPKEQLPKVWEVFHESFASMPEASRITPDDYPDGIYHTAGKHPFGYIGMNQIRPATKEEEQIVIKFANEFGRAYQRFLDLQKAEHQAREAQIEAALERVRSKAMAMRSSEDIGQATKILFEEIEKLGIETMRCGIVIIHKDKTMDAWTTSTTEGNDAVQITGQFDMTIHPLLETVFRGWDKGLPSADYKLQGKDGENYYKAIQKHVSYELPKSNITKDTHYLLAAMFNEGSLFAFTKNQISSESQRILQRFAKVFGLTYQRYRELIESEKREREANKQASLDRVRGEIASMRSTKDLERITPIIWQELMNLGVPFFRCGIFIMIEEKKHIQVFLSDPNGKSLGLMTLDYTTNDLTKNSVKAWKKSEIFKAHWDKDEFINWTKTLIDLGKIKTPIGYQGGDDAPDALDLHFVPFSQGMLYVGNLEPLTDSELALVRNLAESFSIAYARYEDFVKLEKAKENVENALTDLKAAQKQLVQSEKMASLGELTAGIAHEIQNPLNFVNNFSEVSKELLEEMIEEIEAGDMEEVRAIMADLVQNLDKINHHGNRADGIVKGMLQHSRASGDQKEPTDINALTDEYFRLAYHGLRAKDKSFNANLETDYDQSIKAVNIIPQDIGRVILNLFTNAFYAVDEKRIKSNSNGYKPTVSVSTKTIKDNVVISVKDNGDGIPKAIIDKIFQPFFTTKPTGKGTGLGLSMSYDIIKAHHGTLDVKTEKSKYTEFKIALPITKKPTS
ncbi:ATP-binding protein [Winogradskyella ursingii]|uniref:ATP-binding protein n=1 Tax=Winogradskyella ursingii TaxID=2686079 RepID=UPI0015C9CA6C|nr:ATP-binding protein [Winogradskyella ursingii]